MWLLLLLGKNQVLVYLILLLLGLVFPFRWLRNASKEWRGAHFSLEREIAMRHLGRAIFAAVLILLLLFAEFIIGNFVVPGLPASALIGTPTMDLLAGDLSGSVGQAALLETSSTAAPPAETGGCVPGKLEIAFPKPGENISGPVEIIGTVNVAELAFYKYEFAPAGTDLWATISADRGARKNESLGAWNTAALIPGDYLLRLVVTDARGQELNPCIVPVRIVGQ
jgi:hypothetical protein